MTWLEKLLFVTAFIPVLGGCGKTKLALPGYRQNNIHKIEFASGSCLGTCPIKYVMMDSSLEYRFYTSGYFSSKEGYYCGKMTREYWDRLNILMDRSGYRQLPDSSGQDITDAAVTEMYIHNRSGVKHIWGVNFPRPMVNAMALIYYADGWTYMERCDTIAFRCRAEQVILPPEDYDFTEEE